MQALLTKLFLLGVWVHNTCLVSKGGSNVSVRTQKNVSMPVLPEGSSISGLEGRVGTQGMGLYGGAHQIYLDYRAVPSDWIEITPTNWER